MNLRMLSGRGNISGITGWHMPFLTSHHYFVISVSFSSTFFHIFICRYTRKLWKKAALGDGGKVAELTFFFVFRTMSRYFASRICANDSDFSEYVKYKSDKVPKLLA